jgi:ureidoacrylate peracid hydrolase
MSMEFIRPPKLVVVNAKPDPLEIDLSRTAVIAVDMQNAFMSKDGFFDLMGYDISGANGVIQKGNTLIQAAREAGAQIIFLKFSYDPDYGTSGGPESPNWYKDLALVTMRDRPECRGKFLTIGGWDEEICDGIGVKNGDIFVRKQRYSGFQGTNLDLALKTHGIKYCLYLGVATNVCVASTLYDGYFLGYWPLLVTDAVNHSGPTFNRDSAFWMVETNYGWLTTTDDLLAAFSAK